MRRFPGVAAIIIIAAVIGTATTGCSKPSLESITVEPSNVHIYANYGKQLIVTAIDNRGEERDVSAASIYRSSDEKVATVTNQGFIEGKDRGEAEITVSYTVGNATRTATVPVIIELFGGTETFSGIS